MNFRRVGALIERDLRKFFRSPALMMVSMVLPLVQLIVLGYAFGGKVTGVEVGFVDQDHSVESHKVREMFDGITAGPRTFKVIEYESVPLATHDLETGKVRALVVVPHEFSRRFYQHDRPRIAFTEDNTDQFISSAIIERVQQMVEELNAPDVTPRLEGSVQLNTVEIYPYVEYIKYLLAGTIALSIFVVAMIGGGITYIDDKARGFHEGYLTTPITKSELVFSLIGSGVIKGMMTGMVLTIIGGLIVGSAGNLESGAAVLSGDSGGCDGTRDDELHVSADGARGRSAGAARDLWRAEYAAVLSVRCGVPDRGVSVVAEMGFGD